MRISGLLGVWWHTDSLLMASPKPSWPSFWIFLGNHCCDDDRRIVVKGWAKSVKVEEIGLHPSSLAMMPSQTVGKSKPHRATWLQWGVMELCRYWEPFRPGKISHPGLTIRVSSMATNGDHSRYCISGQTPGTTNARIPAEMMPEVLFRTWAPRSVQPLFQFLGHGNPGSRCKEALTLMTKSEELSQMATWCPPWPFFLQQPFQGH